MATITQAANLREILATEAIISSDSHIIEPIDLWDKQAPAALKAHLPKLSRAGADDKPGGIDAKERVREMARDGVSGEVLYTTLALRLFAVEDPASQEAYFRIGNDYMAEYCAAAPDRLWGIPMISCYNVKNAVKELERCKKLGMVGALIWQVPPDHLRFTGDHYEELWAAAQDLDMPVNLHILSGFNYSRLPGSSSGIESHRNSVNTKLHDAITSVFDLIFTGVAERYPRLKFVLVENEIGWIPFVISQWDRYVQRFAQTRPVPFKELPSFYFNRQFYSTFFNDPPGGHLLSYWGEGNCMWSSDFPHGNSTWPVSRQVIERDLGHLSPGVLRKVLRDNVVDLYHLSPPPPLAAT